MAVIYCPDCDSEIPENETVCPSCGFDLAMFDVEEEENDDEFNDLLNAANMKLSEEGTEPSSGSNRSISQSQIDALLDGNVVDLTELDKAVSKMADTEETEELSANKTAAKPDEEIDKSSEEDKKAEAPKPEKKKKEVKIKPPKAQQGGVSMIITIAAAAVALALGFCIGMLVFGDAPQTKEEAFAVRSANALNSMLEVNEELCVYDAYVRLGTAMDECILYAITEYDDNVTASKYRVVVNKDDENTINIYYELDETSPEYIAMRDSDNPELRIQASILKNYSDEIEAAHREISIGTPSWISVDISEINSNITSIRSKTADNVSVSAE